MSETFVHQITNETQRKETGKIEGVEKQAAEIKEGETARMIACAVCHVSVSALHQGRRTTTFPIVTNFVCLVGLTAAARKV